MPPLGKYSFLADNRNRAPSLQQGLPAAARILGVAADLGSIEAGKLADIIVVKGDPLFNITALADVETVVKGGRIFKGGTAR